MFDKAGRGRGTAGYRDPPAIVELSDVTRSNLRLVREINTAAVAHAAGPLPAAGRQRMVCCRKCTVRAGAELASEKLGKLRPGEEVVVLERRRTAEAGWRALVERR
jgi:hypothetical protein